MADYNGFKGGLTGLLTCRCYKYLGAPTGLESELPLNPL